MSDNNIVYRGPGLCSILTVAFIILKLCRVISWSWWWVLAPMWIPFAIVLIILVVGGIIALCMSK